MTKEENLLKKQKEREEEFEQEFPDLLSISYSVTNIEKRTPQEKIADYFHKMVTYLASGLSEKKPENENIFYKLIGKGLKLIEKEAVNLPFDESLLQSTILMQTSLNILSTRVDNLDSNIHPPSNTYNFYKDPNPMEVKIVHNPTMQLLSRIKVIGDINKHNRNY